MSSLLSSVGGFWEHVKHPLDFHRDDLKINISIRDQKIKLLMLSVFCGAAATFLASLIRSKSLTFANKAGFVLLAVGVTGASYYLLTLALKLQRLFAEMNRGFTEGQASIEGIRKEHKELSEQKQAWLKEKQQLVLQRIAEICYRDYDQDGSAIEELNAREKMVSLIQNNQLDVNSVFKYDNADTTLLMEASYCTCPKIILKLLELGADPAFKNGDGTNCLYNLINIESDRKIIVDDILNRFPSLVNVMSPFGYNLLHGVIPRSPIEEDTELPELLERLLKAGADVNAVDEEDGETPFDRIVSYGKPELIKLLMVPELKIDKCKDQGDHIIEKIIKHKLFNDSSVMDKLLELKGWGLLAQQRLFHNVCLSGQEELFQKILELWTVKDKSQNRFINEKIDISGKGLFEKLPIEILLNTVDYIYNRVKQKSMILYLLEFMDISKLLDPSEISLAELICDGQHEALTFMGFNGSLMKLSERKMLERKILLKIKHGLNKQDCVETFKLLYQSGDPIDEDLQATYNENFVHL